VFNQTLYARGVSASPILRTKFELFRWVSLFSCCFGLAQSALALQINRTSSPVLYTDLGASPQMACAYASYSITNNDASAYSNLWVTLDSFTNGAIRLGGGDPGLYNLGTLAVNEARTVFFYLQATNSPATNQHTVRIFRGYPPTGTQLTNANFIVSVDTSGANNANKVNVTIYNPNPPILGGLLQLQVDGDTGNIKVGKPLAFTPACYTNWSAAAFELVSCNITITNSPSNLVYTNILFLNSPIQASGAGYRAQFWFRAVGVTVSNTPVSPVSYIDNGGGTINHCTQASLALLQPVAIPTNTTLLTLTSSVSQLYTNEIVTFTLRFTNSSATDVTLDRVVNTLPPGFSCLSNSSAFNGGSILNPSAAGQVLTWSELYAIPAGASRSLTFQASPASSGFATNSAVAFAKSSQIDATLLTSDNVPATSVVRVLLPPAALNDAANPVEDLAFSVSAPGVLANDSDPNGFALSVVSFTQPVHGGVTVNSNGSYVYTPASNYNGIDSFSYTLTNGNNRAATAIVNLAIAAVNDPPTFSSGPDQTALEDAGAVTIPAWATAISPGPADESAQAVTFLVSNNNSNLFVVQPAISASGTLSYILATNANGTATVSVSARDNGGTANGGSDTSAPQIFIISVTPVNDPPTFSKGADQIVFEDSGVQTVAAWANAISPGPANESGQSISFRVSNNNSNLFSVQPAVSPTGVLSYHPAPSANGVATVTVYAQDNGGTANGGSDSSPSQTFTISILAVNDPPTLDPISDLTIDEDAPLQTINLTGISAGASNETNQALTITATSSNAALLTNVTVNYLSPAGNGTLTFSPVTNAFGSAIITVIAHDNGGSANGGIDSVTNTFTVTVRGRTNTWDQNGNLSFAISDALGAPGSGFTQTNYLGVLDVRATSSQPFTIDLSTLSGLNPGFAANFAFTNAYTWTIATTTRGVIGFSSASFAFDTAGFTNDLGGGVFTVALSSDSNSVNLLFNPNHAPLAALATYGRAWGTSLRIPIDHLLTNFTSDADSDARALVRLGAGTNNAAISTNNVFILFAPANNFSESFPFVIRDIRAAYRAGDTVQTGTNWITVTVTNAVSSAQSISTSGSGISLRFAGVPGYVYDVERSTDLSSWSVLSTTNAPAQGLWDYTDPNPPVPQAFYRTRQH
jgi:uncharacterized repeat protein (TIGR01451 family)